MSQRTVLSIIAATAILWSTTALAASYSEYRSLTSVSGVTLSFKTKARSDGGTDVKFRCKNGSQNDVTPSVRNARFTCHDGRSEERGDQLCGTSRLRPGEESSTTPEYNVCSSNGGVRRVNATLNVKQL